MHEILDAIRLFDGVVEFAPTEGSDVPPIAWGDHFFYYSPDGSIPATTQPYATIVTKDYPDDTTSRLGVDGRWRLNVQVDATTFATLTGGRGPDAAPHDPAEADAVLRHPVYGALDWVAIINPGPRTLSMAKTLLRDAHESARRRAERRDAVGRGSEGGGEGDAREGGEGEEDARVTGAGGPAS
ncbi:DUF6194 family protein [Marisediminicola senii]|uniref:DUF6194 family protein n=1 Tax=Marisediminicola senii TaxID=2711233 RepID=UPI0019147661|nr:DUF6194 family protein [Marisediminicola senii]